MLVLVTRPKGDADRTRSVLESLGHQACVSPMLRIVGTSAKASSNDFDASFVTSANAIAFADKTLLATVAGKPVFAVGDRTAASASAAGLPFVQSAAGDRRALAAIIGERMPEGSRLLYLAGSPRKDALVLGLLTAGFEVQSIEIYRSVPTRELDSASHDLIADHKIGAVLHYSQLSASSFCDTLVNEGLEGELRALSHCCLSDDVAMPLREAAAAAIFVAARPDETSLFATLAQARDRIENAKSGF